MGTNVPDLNIDAYITVLRIWIRIRIRMFLGLLDPDPDSSSIKQK
jgi:hypothetical protein